MRRCAAVLASVLLAATATIDAGVQRVSFRTEDGVTIAATWYEPLELGRPAARHAPAVILVHMLTRSRRDWEPAAQRLASAGIGALAIDLRGHGESAGAGHGGETADYTVMLRDIRAARRFLATRGDVDPAHLGIAGASLGASLAALEAADGPFQSVALLSPSLDYRGLRIEAAARKYGTRPMLLVFSDEDAYARRSSLDLQKTGPSRELLTLTSAGHGTNMLGRAPELAQALADFFRRTLQ